MRFLSSVLLCLSASLVSVSVSVPVVSGAPGPALYAGLPLSGDLGCFKDGYDSLLPWGTGINWVEEQDFPYESCLIRARAFAAPYFGLRYPFCFYGSHDLRTLGTSDQCNYVTGDGVTGVGSYRDAPNESTQYRDGWIRLFDTTKATELTTETPTTETPTRRPTTIAPVVDFPRVTVSGSNISTFCHANSDGNMIFRFSVPTGSTLVRALNVTYTGRYTPSSVNAHAALLLYNRADGLKWSSRLGGGGAQVDVTYIQSYVYINIPIEAGDYFMIRSGNEFAGWCVKNSQATVTVEYQTTQTPTTQPPVSIITNAGPGIPESIVRTYKRHAFYTAPCDGNISSWSAKTALWAGHQPPLLLYQFFVNDVLARQAYITKDDYPTNWDQVTYKTHTFSKAIGGAVTVKKGDKLEFLVDSQYLMRLYNVAAIGNALVSSYTLQCL